MIIETLVDGVWENRAPENGEKYREVYSSGHVVTKTFYENTGDADVAEIELAAISQSDTE